MVSFKVEGKAFWILEQKEVPSEEEEKASKKKVEPQINAWVFSTEPEAIKKLKELIGEDGEEPTADEEGDPYDALVEKYNLQRVEIAADKYNVKPISWAKIALMLLKGG